MPKVRQITQPEVTPQRMSQPLQRFDTRGAFGESVAGGLADVATIVQRQQDENDLTVTKERVNGYRERSRARMYGDDDAYLGRAGRDAYDGRDGIRKELDDVRKEMAKGLNPRQAKLFNTAVQGYVDRDLDGIAKHSQTQRRSWLNDQDAATILSAQEDGGLHWNDNADYGVQIRKTVSQLGARQGWSDERIENETEARMTAMHVTALDNILETSPDQANDYFAANLDEIVPSIRDDIRAKIDKRLDTVWSQAAADTIRNGGGTLKDRLSDVNAIEDPARRKLVRTQVEHDYRMEKIVDQETRLEAYDSAIKDIFIAGQNPHQWRANNFDKWETLSGQQQQALMKPESAGQTDLNAYYQMKGLMATNRDKAREYLAGNIHKFSATDAKGFIDEMFKPTAGKKPVQTDLAAFNKTAESVLGKKPPGRQTLKNWNKNYTRLMGMYQQQIDDWFEENPSAKHLPAEERQKILDLFQIESTREDVTLWFDDELPFTELIDDVPEQDVIDISEALREQGLPVTTHNIREAYEATR